MEISAIKPLDLYSVQKVLASPKLSESQKTQYLRQNSPEINHIMAQAINSGEYKTLMKSRPLQKFRPIKNSFTKRGDKILLAQALNIEPVEVDNYIENICLNTEEIGNVGSLSYEKAELVKTYVYRHGKKSQVVEMLDWELRSAKNKIKTLYNTFDYNTQGVADYFRRPIHRMDNKTMIGLYYVCENNLKEMENNGTITATERADHAKWALIRIFQIQNNSKLIEAVKTYKHLK